MVGITTILLKTHYITSNRESGEGRYDILMIPHDKSQRGIVIEFKHTEAQQSKETNEQFTERINLHIAEALLQMERNHYYHELLAHALPMEQIVKVAIVFAGKMPYVCPSE